MPYAVWIELIDPDPRSADEMTQAQRPQLILELIQANRQPEPPRDLAALTEDDPANLLDVRVLTSADGARIGVAVDTDHLESSLGTGFDLARRLSGSPALFGWRLESLRAERLSAPRGPGGWLPPDEEQTRFPVAAHLPGELRELAAHYLLAAAAGGLDDPAGRGRRTVAAADVVAGAVEDPWGRELTGALGALLVAACRAEAALGVRHALVGRGSGDPRLAQALLDTVRLDEALPATGYDEDRMRGHVLLENFMVEQNLLWNRVDDSGTADGERGRQQLRALLWAGLRALATMGRSTLRHAESPWVWLAELGSDEIDEVARQFAYRDLEAFEEAAENAEDQLHAATHAHLLLRLALRRPDLVDGNFPTAAMGAFTEPLRHLGFQTLLSLGAATVERTARTPLAESTASAARTVLPALHAIAADEDDAFDDLYDAIDHLLPGTPAPREERRHRTRTFLDLVTSAAAQAGDEQSARIARELLTTPAESACVQADLPDGREIEHALRLRVLATAAGLDPDLAGAIAADLPALRSPDPRDEPALRAEATRWWRTATTAAHRLRDDAPDLRCPEPGAELLHAMRRPDAAHLEALPTETVAVAVVQVISALSIAAQEPYLPHEILLRPE